MAGDWRKSDSATRGSVIFDGFSHQLPDVDPEETSEWIDSFDAVVDTRFKVSGYDFMGAALILSEAGGLTRRMDGLSIDTLPLNTSGVSIIAATNQGLMDRLLTVVSIRKRR